MQRLLKIVWFFRVLEERCKRAEGNLEILKFSLLSRAPHLCVQLANVRPVNERKNDEKKKRERKKEREREREEGLFETVNRRLQGSRT